MTTIFVLLAILFIVVMAWLAVTFAKGAADDAIDSVGALPVHLDDGDVARLEATAPSARVVVGDGSVASAARVHDLSSRNPWLDTRIHPWKGPRRPRVCECPTRRASKIAKCADES